MIKNGSFIIIIEVRRMKILIIIMGIIAALVACIMIGGQILRHRDRKLTLELESKHALPKDKLQLLAYGAILAHYRDESPRIIPIKLAREQLKEGLERYWDVGSRQEAFNVLEWLIDEGHRTHYDSLYRALKTGNGLEVEDADVIKSRECYESAQRVMRDSLKFTDEHYQAVDSIAAWDYDRAINIARWSHALDYITEHEMWNFIRRSAVKAGITYNSWEEYYIAFAFGRAIAFHGSATQIVGSTEALFKKENSLWKELSFKQGGIRFV
jgi:hypothetical protein